MIGAIIGDIIGSRFERRRNNIKTKEFDLFTPYNRFTDDSVLSIAIAKAILEAKDDQEELRVSTIRYLLRYGQHYPHCGFGGGFKKWLWLQDPQPYGSFGNGAAMRVGACGLAADSLSEALSLAEIVTAVTHNHPEGIKGAKATAAAVFLANQGSPMEEIEAYIHQHYYPMNFTLDEIREDYCFDVSCQGTVPYAIKAFLESKDFEDAIRNAISIGGDSDTIGAITGSMAEAYYDVPLQIREQALTYLDPPLVNTLQAFEATYPLRKFTDRT